MFTVSSEMLKDENLKTARQAIRDIMSALVPYRYDKRNTAVVLASYLLSRISTFNDLSSYDYQKLLDYDWEFSEESSFVIREYISEDCWQKILPLAGKYSPEDFAVAAMIQNIDGLFGGNEETPESVLKLAQRILNIKQDEAVADLCCGTGSFILSSILAGSSAYYHGYEINTEQKLIASIRSLLTGGHADITQCDVFSLSLQDAVPRFDKLFANYPFKVSLRSFYSGEEFFYQLSRRIPGVFKATSSDWCFNALICDMMKENGKAVAIMTNGSTWNGFDTSMRKYFVENGLIECVIALPGRMFNSTAIATSMIVFSRGNTAVRLIDASEKCRQGRRYNEFSIDDIDTIISALDTDSEYSRSISFDELRANEYTLSLTRYQNDNLTFTNAVHFGEVINRITRGAPCTASQLDEMASDGITDMQYLMLANIQDGMINDNLPYLRQIDPKYEKYCLKDNDLILSKNGYPYKVAVAKVQEGQKILANGNLYIIELDQTRVDPYFLKAFFESEQGIAVLKRITVGATIPNIGVDNLKNIRIPLPSLDEQRRIAKRYQTILDEIAVHKLAIERAMSRLHHVFDEESEG